MILLLIALLTSPVCGPVLTVDRIVDGEWAVIETPDAETYDMPAWALPEGTREGDKIQFCKEASR